ncbi:MAG: glycosyltransferase family 39 protein [Nitrospina sp.]|jgi:4-amino-4-deoxy-L-arabinose transferase-like glycosyltransferase|nr:glycosyltransferase family 39 protein [Nitrospina sp.]MBT3876933.1 glycosyltransferase family 39 protein [Nitrospina sp.]MBT4047939.1 glycosyltransferase family 39 protein [Nitrospina sp.]MBT4558847.1 glycosyltransferase family 39 protein [Nitrospina sp.]MBT5348367.1 glycosyltransferase family 39 protein [Nitrospina sp.]
MPTFPSDYFSKATEKQLVFFWLVFCFIALTYKLGGVPPYHSDENFYVESSRNMVESGDYLTPVYNDKKRFAKPILYYWMVSISYKIFGVSLDSARLTSAFFGSLTIGLLYLISCRLFEGRIGFYSILILPSTFLHFQISRWATTDIVMSFFILLSLYYFVRSFQSDFKKRSEIYLFYVAMSLGFMVKGPPAILIPGIIALVFIVTTKRWEFSPQFRIGQGIIIFLLLVLPWFATMYFLHGDQFKDHIIGNEIKGRLVHATPFSLYYFGVLFRYHLPWSLFFFIAVLHQFGFYSYSPSPASGLLEYFKKVPLNFKSKIRLLFLRENESILFCYIWVLVCLVLFVLVRTEHSRYMLPASSAVAMLTAKFFVDLENFKGGWSWLGYKVPAIFTGVILLVAGVSSGSALYALDLFYHVPLRIFILPLIFIAGGVVALRLLKAQENRKQIVTISLTLILGFSFLSGEVISYANRYPMKLFSERILTEKFSGSIAIYRLGNQRARLGVLTGQKVIKLYTSEHFKSFLKTNEQVRVVMKEEDLKREFSDMPLKIVAEDIVWLEGRIDWKRVKELYEKAESGGFSNLTEKIYLLSNK